MNPGYIGKPWASITFWDEYSLIMSSPPTSIKTPSFTIKDVWIEKLLSAVYIFALWTIRSTFWLHEHKMTAIKRKKFFIFFKINEQI